MKTRKEILEQLIEQNENAMEINKIKIGYYTRQKISSLNDNQLNALDRAIKNTQVESNAMGKFNIYLLELQKEEIEKNAKKNIKENK